MPFWLLPEGFSVMRGVNSFQFQEMNTIGWNFQKLQGNFL